MQSSGVRREGIGSGVTCTVRLTPGQQATLQSWLRAGTTELRMARRAAYVLARADGLAVCQIARDMQTVPRQVRLWCNRFVAKGFEGLRDRPRPGRPRTLSLKANAPN
jgi:hypothetical protein